VVVACISSVVLQATNLFARPELQSINLRFDARRWLCWSPRSLERANPIALWNYHQNHEIPRTWWHWDYTLSWLIAENHPELKHKFIIFNHLLEDEPTAEAVIEHPWMKPLLHWPQSRATVAQVVKFLAQSGARLIILDREFPEYSEHDHELADAIRQSTSGAFGQVVPVLMVRTINRRSFGNVLQLEIPSTPGGLSAELESTQGQSVLDKYIGTVGVFADEDQVMRQLASRMPGWAGRMHESIVLKALRAIGEKPPDNVPKIMDIDFVGPPNGDLYPVRPFSYLLDPQLQEKLVHPPPGSEDVSLKNAIVVLGDGVVDLFSTPTTNMDVNLMSGSEVLVNCIDTVSRGVYPTRVTGFGAYLYSIFACIIGGIILIACKKYYSARGTVFSHKEWAARLIFDLSCLVGTVFGSYLLACLLFAYCELLLPVVVPAVSLMIGALAATLWERERERLDSFRQSLKAAEDRLALQEEIYKAELNAQEANAQSREMERDKARRHEFARKINHDLRAPVSVLSWTISRLKKDGLNSKNAADKLDRLANTSDRLFALINELIKSYEETAPQAVEKSECDLFQIVSDCFKMQSSLAEQRESVLELDAKVKDATVIGNPLEIARVVDNLIRNALLHNKPGTNVVLRLEAGEGFYKITVRDSGKGIPPDKQQRIFESGFRIAAIDGEQKPEGQGLGLSIVKGLVESLGGKIEVESESGQGCTFTLTIPAARLQKNSSEAEADDDSSSAGGTARQDPSATPETSIRSQA